MKNISAISSRQRKDISILENFFAVYCRKNHNSPELCKDCSKLLDYAIDRIKKCPQSPKPKCKDCKIHCFADPQRQQIKKIMKFAGIHYIKRGRLDWLIKYFT